MAIFVRSCCKSEVFCVCRRYSSCPYPRGIKTGGNDDNGSRVEEIKNMLISHKYFKTVGINRRQNWIRSTQCNTGRVHGVLFIYIGRYGWIGGLVWCIFWQGWECVFCCCSQLIAILWPNEEVQMFVRALRFWKGFFVRVFISELGLIIDFILWSYGGGRDKVFSVLLNRFSGCLFLVFEIH